MTEIQGNYRVSYVTDIFEIVASGANVVTVSNLSDATGLTKTYDGAGHLGLPDRRGGRLHLRVLARRR